MIRRFVIVAAFIALYLIARVPYLGAPLWGEEGEFAHILLASPKGGQYLLIGRLNSKPQYCVPEHPAFLYEAIKLAGKPFRVAVPAWEAMSEYELVRLLRFTFCLFLLTVFSGALWFNSARKSHREAPVVSAGSMAMLAAVSISPLAVTTSVGLQIDAGTGVLMMGVLPVVVLAFHQGWLSRNTFVALAALGGALTGLGKNEWTLALLAAILTASTFAVIFARLWRERPAVDLWTMAWVLGGLALGNAVSYLYDPANHVGGLAVMTRIFHEEGYPQTVPLRRYMELLGATLPMLFTPYLLLSLLSVTAARWLRSGDVWIFFLSAYGLSLLLGFMLSPHAMASGEPRYFVPSMMVLMCGGLAAWPIKRPRWTRAVVAVIIVGIAIPSVLAILWHLPVSHESRKANVDIQAGIARMVAHGRCLPILPAAQGWRRIDFAADSIPLEYQQSFAAKVGLPLCPH